MSAAPEFIQRAMQVFLAAVDLPAAEQAAFVDHECGAYEALRERVRELLRHADDDDAMDPVAPSARCGEAAAGVELGEFLLKRQLGRGGMGVVWLAEQQSLQRQVALKLVPPMMATPELLKRIEREAAILGRLQHPGIASVYAVGSASLGGGEQHFFAMELVRGEPLDKYVEANDLDVDARLGLIALISDAVHHAHQQGVVHRDLKPDNILVMANGEPKVLDFGIARATCSDVTVMTMQTAVGQLVGTVPYMSPEQVLGDSSQIDARSDVYALGALLYQLLSGRLPADVRDRSVPEAARIIRDEDPTRLATIVTTCRGDVDTIVHKALEKERERRYQTAGAMAADIRRYLAHEPIVARPTTTLYQVRKFARRHKGLVGGLLATMVVLIVGVVVSALLAIDANRSAAQATQNAAAFERAAYSQSLMVASAALADHDVATAERALQSSPERLRGWEWRHLHSRLDMSLVKLELPDYFERAFAYPAFSADGRRLSMWVERKAEGFGGWLHTLESWDLATGVRQRPREQVAIAAEQRYCTVTSSGYSDGQAIHLFRTEPYRHLILDKQALPPGQEISSFRTDAEGRVVAFSVVPPVRGEGMVDITDHVVMRTEPSNPGWRTQKIGNGLVVGMRADGHRVAMRDSHDGGVTLWDEQLGTIPLVGHSGYVTSLGASADWRTVASGVEGGIIRTWNGETGVPIASSPSVGTKAFSVAVSAGGELVASGTEDGLVRLWNGATLDPIAVLHGHRNPRAGWLSFSPDGSLLVSWTYQSNEFLRIWDTGVAGDPWRMGRHDSYVYALAVSPGGNLVASGGWDDTVRLWDTATLRELVVLRGHRDWVGSVAFSPDGSTLASVGLQQRLRLWDVTEPLRSRLLREVDDYRLHPTAPITWHPDGRTLLLEVGEETVRLLDTITGRERVEPLATLRSFDSGIVSGEGSRFVRFDPQRHQNWDEGDWLRLCATDTGRELARVSVGTNTAKFAFSPRGSGPLRLLVPLAREQGRETKHGWRLLDATTGAILQERVAGRSPTMALAFSPDGKRFVTAGFEQDIIVWDAAHHDELVQLSGHTSYVFRLAYGPDGERLYSAGGDGAVRFWGTEPLREVLLARRKK